MPKPKRDTTTRHCPTCGAILGQINVLARVKKIGIIGKAHYCTVCNLTYYNNKPLYMTKDGEVSFTQVAI